MTAGLRRLARRVWFRAALVTLAGILLALAAGLIGAWIPFPMSIDLGQGSVSNLLQIIATSMLAVSTFSLTAMVTAYGSASTIGTPRATQLLVADRTSQNVLSLFVGSFAFALVGLIALSTGYYNEQGRTVLFFGTLVVVALIVVSLLRWIDHLSAFGRMSDVIDRTERAAREVVCAYAARPALGGVVLRGDPPAAVRPVHAEKVGYVTHVDLAGLQRAAEEVHGRVYVTATPGRQTDALVALAEVPADAPDEFDDAVRRAFLIENHRTFEQDPRLGVIALAEIGMRALSPAVNDPGTAIEVVAAMERVFSAIPAQREAQREPTQPEFDRVHVRPVALGDLVQDAFRPIARDGAGHLEVQVRLQKTLCALATRFGADGEPFRQAAADAARRAGDRLDAADRRALRHVRRDLW